MQVWLTSCMPCSAVHSAIGEPGLPAHCRTAATGDCHWQFLVVEGVAVTHWPHRTCLFGRRSSRGHCLARSCSWRAILGCRYMFVSCALRPACLHCDAHASALPGRIQSGVSTSCMPCQRPSRCTRSTSTPSLTSWSCRRVKHRGHST